MSLYIIGKSKARKDISVKTGIKLYKGQTGAKLVINYGLGSTTLAGILKKLKTSNNVLVVNRYVGLSKLHVVKKMSSIGVTVPDSKLKLSLSDKLSDWIEKKIYSSQGNGIIAARGKNELQGKYYQKMVKDRKYELRVHAFSWMPMDSWKVDKRIGPADQIAWNFHKGGHFQSVSGQSSNQGIFNEAKKTAKKVLETLGMGFGAVDFIVDSSMKLYFIEVNSSPGFSELNEKVYVDAMNKLKGLGAQDASKFGRL